MTSSGCKQNAHGESLDHLAARATVILMPYSLWITLILIIFWQE